MFNIQRVSNGLITNFRMTFKYWEQLNLVFEWLHAIFRVMVKKLTEIAQISH